MKTVLVLVASLLAFSASARTRTKTFTHRVSAETEERVLEKVEIAIPLIVSGKITSPIQDSMSCWPSNSRTIKVTNVSIHKTYDVDNDGMLNPRVSGKITYRHRSCRD